MAKSKLAGTILFILALAIFLFSMENVSAANVNNGFSYIFGKIQDAQLQPVEGVEVSLVSGVDSGIEILSTAIAQADGSYAIKIPIQVPEQAKLQFSRHHLLPSVTALIGASALLIWIRPDIDEMIGAVDWTTLVFFMSLFIVVGAIQEVGLISAIATVIGELIGQNLVLAMIVVTWFSAILSMVIGNIPFTAAMLPVIAYLTLIIPGADSKVLFYCLSIGAAMGGNGSLFGASANMITAGIAERAGYKISYKYFMKKGIPALIITISLSLLWLFIRF